MMMMLMMMMMMMMMYICIAQSLDACLDALREWRNNDRKEKRENVVKPNQVKSRKSLYQKENVGATHVHNNGQQTYERKKKKKERTKEETKVPLQSVVK